MKLIRTAAVACIAACTLTACHPPNQQDSDKRVDTATGVAAPTLAPSGQSTATAATSTAATATAATATSSELLAAGEVPGYIDCVGAPTEKPTSISLSCADNKDRLENIVWQSWDDTSATGTAVRETNNTTRNVDVQLTKPVTSPQGVVYSQVQVDGTIITM